jgi:hypothetical protein
MVGGKREDHGFGAVLGTDVCGPRRNGGTRIPRLRLKQDVGRKSNLLKLIGDQEAMLAIGDDHRFAEETRI